MRRSPLSVASRVALGAAPPAPVPEPTEESFTLADLKRAIGQVTPTLLVVGIATGAAFAIGSGLASRYLLKGR